MVLQRRCYFFTLSPGPSLRTGLQFAPDIVRRFLGNSTDSVTDRGQLCSAELEMTVNILIQIDKLVQLLESPVFTCEY